MAKKVRIGCELGLADGINGDRLTDGTELIVEISLGMEDGTVKSLLGSVIISTAVVSPTSTISPTVAPYSSNNETVA